MAALFEFPSARAGLPAMSSTEDLCVSDEALVRAAQQGDRSAFGTLYSRYARMVHGILLSRVPSTDAEDLVQEVFLQALPRLRSLRDVSRFPGWLAAIARNRAVDFHRRGKPSINLVQDYAHSESEEHPEIQKARPQASAEAQAALEAIRTLPDAYRETLVLRLVEGMTGPEIAARTGLTHGSVRVNLHRGMQQLRKLLAKKSAAQGGGL